MRNAHFSTPPPQHARRSRTTQKERERMPHHARRSYTTQKERERMQHMRGEATQEGRGMVQPMRKAHRLHHPSPESERRRREQSEP